MQSFKGGKRERWDLGGCLKVSFGGDKSVSKLTVVMVIKPVSITRL